MLSYSPGFDKFSDLGFYKFTPHRMQISFFILRQQDSITAYVAKIIAN